MVFRNFVLLCGLVCLPLLTSAQEVEKSLPAGELSQTELSANLATLSQRAEVSMSNGDWSAAEKIWQSVLQMPDLPMEWQRVAANNLAVCLIRQKRYSEAQRLLTDTLNAEPSIAMLLKNLNELYAYEAQQAYREVFKKSYVQEPQGLLLQAPLKEADEGS